MRRIVDSLRHAARDPEHEFRPLELLGILLGCASLVAFAVWFAERVERLP